MQRRVQLDGALAAELGERGFVQSICASDWTPAMELLATRVAQAPAE